MLARRRSVLFLTVLLAVGQSLAACPPPIFPERTLFHAIREADLVVVVEIKDVSFNKIAFKALALAEELEDRIRGFGFDVTLPKVEPTAVFDLVVIETLKGRPLSRVQLPVDGWPYSDSGPAGGRELAFFLVHGLRGWQAVSAPVLVSDSAAAADLREMVRRADAVDLSVAVGPRSRRAWTVEAVRRPGTRLYALLAIRREFRDLSADEYRRIAEGFVSNPSSDEWEIRLALELLAPYPSQEVDRVAQTILERLPDDAWNKSEISDLVLARRVAAQGSPASRNP